MDNLIGYVFGNNLSSPLTVAAAWLFGFIGTFIGFCFGNWWGLIIILLFLMFADTIIGIAAARKLGEPVTSETFWEKFFWHKVIGYGFAIGIAVCFDKFILVYLTNGIDLISFVNWIPFADEIVAFLITVIMVSWLIFKETWSVIENLSIIDSKIIPSPIKKAVLKMMGIFNPED